MDDKAHKMVQELRAIDTQIEELREKEEEIEDKLFDYLKAEDYFTKNRMDELLSIYKNLPHSGMKFRIFKLLQDKGLTTLK